MSSQKHKYEQTLTSTSRKKSKTSSYSYESDDNGYDNRHHSDINVDNYDMPVATIGYRNESLDVEQLLPAFIQHDSLEFHTFTREEAYNIRTALLTWYRRYRRKLPWRGDPPPWNGSVKDFTIRIALEKQKHMKQEQEQEQEQQHQQEEDIEEETKQKEPVGSRWKKVGPTPKKIHGNKKVDVTSPKQQHFEFYERTYPVTPYGVWISEIMVQNTPADAVIGYWLKWMNMFPTIEILANASEDSVNTAWVGLGYYRRVKCIHNAAKIIRDNPNMYHGTLPSSIDELQKLPGIGKFTACAIASIAYNQQVPAVDGNVCRILSRLRCIAQHTKASILTSTYGYMLVQQLLDATSPNPNNSDSKTDDHHLSCTAAGEFNQAMMELGATYCSPSGVGVDLNDPLREFYWSTKLGELVYITDPTDLSNIISRRDIDRENNGGGQNYPICPVCDANGIMDVIENLTESIIDIKNQCNGKIVQGMIDTARINGFGVFPCAAPKLSQRHEIYVTGAISCTLPNAEKAWLLVKRPNKGLLAGQWEFPSTLVWSSVSGDLLFASDDEDEDDDDEDDDDADNRDHNDCDEKKKKKKDKKKRKSLRIETPANGEIPTLSKRQRRKALKKILKSLVHSSKDDVNTTNDSWILSPFVNDPRNCRKKFVLVGNNTLDMPHVRSSIWLMLYDTNRHHPYCSIDNANNTPSNTPFSTTTASHISFYPEQWIDSSHREVRWMRESEIKGNRVTPRVQKLYKAIQLYFAPPYVKKPRKSRAQPHLTLFKEI